jgi:tRNA/tmRNA/rRNA uracil-C5-methylase (TrmA/RlmC/RlmD family)
MPGVVPPAQGRRRQPGAVGGVAPRGVTSAPAASPREGSRPPGPGRERGPGGGAGGSTAPQQDGTFVVGQDIEVAIEDVAQGGWCVARPEGLPVMFVRHTLPGERVIARVTEVTTRFARADAVRVLERSADRVEPPCPSAHPGGCGGCDWQHVSLSAQRALKAAVITEQLRRLAGIDRAVTVEPLPGDGADGQVADSGGADGTAAELTAAGGSPGLGWRTRVQFAVDERGVAGLRAHRSHEVIDIGVCPIAHPAIRELDLTGDNWSGAAAVEAAVGGAGAADNFAVTVVEDGGRPRQAVSGKRGDSRGGRKGRPVRPARTLVEGRPYLAEQAAGRIWQVSADGFWQVHPAAADTLSGAVVEALQPGPGDTVLDLYCGAGLFAGAVAPLVGPQGAVTGIESDRAAVRNARQNLADVPWASFREADVAVAASAGDLPPVRLVIADPPRTGLAREIVSYLAGDGPAERFAYVSCDPATLARDLGLLTAGRWQLTELRAFDAFPMTHHVECLATLVRTR